MKNLAHHLQTLPARQHSSAGWASMAALVGIIPLLVISGSVMSLMVSYKNGAELRFGRETAKAIAFTGAQDCLALLERDPDFVGTYQFAVNGGTAVLQVTDQGTDGLDNDNDGAVDDAWEASTVRVRCDGYLNVTVDAAGAIVDRAPASYQSVVEVVLRRIGLSFDFAQAIYIDNPMAGFEVRGDSFRLAGSDRNLDGTFSELEDQAAIGVPGDPSYVAGQISSQQWDNVTGAGPNPSVQETPELDLDEYFEVLTPKAAVRWSEEEASFSGDLGDLESQTPVVAYASGDLILHGGTTGAGVLLVEGDLEIRGSFAFAGVIVVRGALSVRGGGRQIILGSVLSRSGLGVEDESVESRGRVYVQFSSEANGLAAASAGSFSLVSWNQD